MTDTGSELTVGLILSCGTQIYTHTYSHITNAYSLKVDRDKNDRGEFKDKSL